MKTFFGYKRPDGRVGIRNNVLILPCSVCASDTTRIIASKVEGAVTFNNQLGCSQIGIDMEYTMDVMSGFAANPNIYATVLVALGCENCQIDMVKAAIEKRTNKPIKTLVIQEEGGVIKTIEKALNYAISFVKEANTISREEVSISELVIGTECGGSDPTSGLAANPVIGALSDLIIEAGGTSVLSETTEFIGAEHILAKRAETTEVKKRIFDIVSRYEKHIKINTGHDVRDGNPSPGNKVGGITTLEEKSLGCIHKGGESNITAVYDYAKPITNKGLVIMDTPGNDPSSLTGMIAGGCQIVVFSTGLGTPTGHPISPIIKITGNRDTYKKMEDSIDFNASGVIYSKNSIKELGDNLLEVVIEICNGELTKSEVLGFIETAIQRASNFV